MSNHLVGKVDFKPQGIVSRQPKQLPPNVSGLPQACPPPLGAKTLVQNLSAINGELSPVITGGHTGNKLDYMC